MKGTPYLKVVDMPRVMSGKGAPRPTLFGVIGKTNYEPDNKVLGGLVTSTIDRMPKKVTFKEPKGMHSDRGASTGKKSATCIPGQHYGQVPYQGKFMSTLGSRL
jgi:hypothetical protein